MKRTFLILIAALVGITVSSCLNIFREADRDVSKKTADYELEAKALVESFEMHEDSANLRYLDKIVLVEGKVTTISEKEEVTTVYLKEDEDLTGVLCSFNPGSIDTKSLKVGDKIKVKGICSGYLLDVVLNRCSVVTEEF